MKLYTPLKVLDCSLSKLIFALQCWANGVKTTEKNGSFWVRFLPLKEATKDEAHKEHFDVLSVEMLPAGNVAKMRCRVILIPKRRKSNQRKDWDDQLKAVLEFNPRRPSDGTGRIIFYECQLMTCVAPIPGWLSDKCLLAAACILRSDLGDGLVNADNLKKLMKKKGIGIEDNEADRIISILWDLEVLRPMGPELTEFELAMGFEEFRDVFCVTMPRIPGRFKGSVIGFKLGHDQKRVWRLVSTDPRKKDYEYEVATVREGVRLVKGDSVTFCLTYHGGSEGGEIMADDVMVEPDERDFLGYTPATLHPRRLYPLEPWRDDNLGTRQFFDE